MLLKPTSPTDLLSCLQGQGFYSLRGSIVLVQELTLSSLSSSPKHRLQNKSVSKLPKCLHV